MRFSKYEIEDLISQFDIPINTIESLSEDFKTNFLKLNEIELGDLGIKKLDSQFRVMHQYLQTLRNTIYNGSDKVFELENNLKNSVEFDIFVPDIEQM